jgi:glycosyltransferase involved in cell wall biosynthesis
VKILIVTDAWRPQINGVVRTLEMTARELTRLGHETRVVGPDMDRRLTFSVPFYPEIKLELFARARLARIFDDFEPDAIHIATEGPLGWSARAICKARGLGFSTAYHTRFPEYLSQRMPRPFAGIMRAAIYTLLRCFHAPSRAIMVATASIERELVGRGFARLHRWSRGVDLSLFRPYGKDLAEFEGLPRPVLIYVGRLAAEKNLPAFLSLKTPGAKVVVGDGPAFAALRQTYPDAHFLGAKQGLELARCYAAADLFVFPSIADTFGLVLLEACASGLRIAALPAPGPLDIFGRDSAIAALDDELGRAVTRALSWPTDPETPRAFAEGFTWAACTGQFLEILKASLAHAGETQPARAAPPREAESRLG